jgi:SCP-2 sterol transfer family
VFDPHTRLSPACLPIVVEREAQRRRWRQAPSDAVRIAPSIRYRFEVTGVPHYRTEVILTDAHQYMETVGTTPADVTFRCDGDTFVLLMYGRIRAHEAVSQGRMTFEGDTEFAAAFSQRFKGG